jgi:O-antigen/teichoic acid export membrane protein
MYKALMKDASLYSLSSVLARGFSLITVPIFTRILSPADYGALDLLSSAAAFLPLIFGLALDQAVARFYIPSDNPEERQRIVSSVLIYTVIALLVVAAALIPVAELLAREWLDDQVSESTVFMVLVYMWIHSLFITVNNQLRYMFMAKQYAICNIGNTTVSMSLSVWFVAVMNTGIIGIFLAQAIGQAIFAALSFYFVRSNYRLVFDWKIFRKMIHYSLPLVPSAVAYMGMLYADRYIINELRSLQEVGFYGIGARLASLVRLFIVGFMTAWHPIVMKSYMTDGAVEKFRTVFNYYVFVTCMILVCLSLFSEEILLLLTTRTFSAGYVVVPLLISSAITASISTHFTYGLQIRKKSLFRLYINIGGLFLNVLLNVILVRKLGIVGAALGTFLSFLIIAWIGMLVSQRLYHVPYEWNRILLAVIIAISISHVVVMFPMEISIHSQIIKLLLASASILSMARLLRISGARRILAVLRR